MSETKRQNLVELSLDALDVALQRAVANKTGVSLPWDVARAIHTQMQDTATALVAAREENEKLREALAAISQRDAAIVEALFWLTSYEWDENGMEESGNTEAVLYWDRDDVRGIVLSLDGKAVGPSGSTGAGSTPATIPALGAHLEET